jgi:hypothetical protein
LFADGPKPSAKKKMPSAKSLPMAISGGHRHSAIGRHFIGKGVYADGHLSGRRHSFADGRGHHRQTRHVSRPSVRPNGLFADG